MCETVLLFVIVRSVLSGFRFAGLPSGRMLRNGYPNLCSALTALGPDKTSKLVFFIFQSLPSLETWASIMEAIKCLKGVQWMPWHQEAMKDVVRCDKLWGGANNL